MLSTILAFFVALASFGQEIVKGTVYHDKNGNGKRDRSESGIANVAISNGVQVVQTGKSGKYELPVSEDNIIFVIKPSGYALPMNAQNDPVFYHIHKPNGSPKSKFAGVEPTGKLPKSLDFALIPSVEDKEFTALVFGDSQMDNMEQVEYFQKSIIDEVKKTKGDAVLGITLGDLVGDRIDLHPVYKKMVAQLGLPWFNIIGNHDMNHDAKTDSLSDESYERLFGPTNYSFNYGDVHFIMLDDVFYPNPIKGRGYIGGFRDTQIEYVKNDLKYVPKDKLIVLSYHIPFFNNPDHFMQDSKAKLFELLSSYDNVLGLSAHTHVQKQMFHTAESGWKGATPFHEYNVGTTCGDWYSGKLDPSTYNTPLSTMGDGTPRGYVYLNFKGSTYDFDYKVVGKPLHYQIRIVGPKYINKVDSHKIPIYANFFVGKKGDKVSYSLDGGDWKDMGYTHEVDPYYLQRVFEYDMTDEPLFGKRPNNIQESSHLWKTKLPRNMSIGKHIMRVRAVDMFGKTHTEEFSFEILDR